MRKDSVVSLTGLAFALGLTFGVLASTEVQPADVGSDNLTVNPTFVTEQSVTSHVNIMDNALSRATLFEGFRAEVYTFRGECHIGYGHRTSCSNTDVMTHQSAAQLLQADMRSIQGELMQALSFYNNLHPNAKVVLLDMGLNMGLTNLLEFETMLGHLEMGNWWEAILALEDSVYFEQVNNRAMANIDMLFILVQEEQAIVNSRRVF